MNLYTIKLTYIIMSSTIRQSTRQVKRKVHFESDINDYRGSEQSVQNDIKPKKQRKNNTQPKTIDPELDALGFLSDYRASSGISVKINIVIVNHIIKMYEDYLIHNSKINEPIVNLISFMTSIYKINLDDIFHYNQVKNFIFTAFRIGCTNIDFIIQMLTNTRNEYTKYNVFNMLQKIPLTSVSNTNQWSNQVNYIQKDLDCINNVKSQLLLWKLDFTIENVMKIINKEITSHKCIQFVALDIILMTNKKFTNIIDKSNCIEHTSMTKLEIENRYTELKTFLNL